MQITSVIETTRNGSLSSHLCSDRQTISVYNYPPRLTQHSISVG